MAKKAGRTAKGSQTPIDEDMTIPVWMSLGTRFYELLNQLAVRENMLRSDVLMNALRLFSEKKKPSAVKGFFKGKPGAEEAFREFVGAASKERWKNKSEEERSKWGSMAATARWERARQKRAEEEAAQESKPSGRKKKTSGLVKSPTH